MKTTLRGMALIILLAFTFVSCGANNTSGTGRRSARDNGANNAGIAGFGTSSPHIQTVMAENPCVSGQGRVTVTLPLQMNVATNQTYVGVTSEGDVAVISNQGQPAMTMYICQRYSLGQGQGQLLGNPAIASSPNCQVNEITAATVALPPAMQGLPPLYLMFRAIYYGRGSSLCQGMGF